MEKTLKGKKIAMIVAQHDFRDEELLIPLNIFLAEGATVKIISEKKGKAIGSYGGVVEVNLALNELNVLDFDAIIFIGGSGAAKYISDERCHEIAQKTVSSDKLLGAICIAPTILAKAGILRGKKATVWSGVLDKSTVKTLESGGAKYQKELIVTDGKIITASGPAAARKFGETIVKALI